MQSKEPKFYWNAFAETQNGENKVRFILYRTRREFDPHDQAYYDVGVKVAQTLVSLPAENLKDHADAWAKLEKEKWLTQNAQGVVESLRGNHYV